MRILRIACPAHCFFPYRHSILDVYKRQERSVYIRVIDDAYPAVKRFEGVTEGGMNAYHVYTYYGTLKDLVFLYDLSLIHIYYTTYVSNCCRQ